jgi:hypothetical protein
MNVDAVWLEFKNDAEQPAVSVFRVHKPPTLKIKATDSSEIQALSPLPKN